MFLYSKPKGGRNMVFQPFTFTIEKGKVREFAMAIGDNHPAYLKGEQVPPTFATVIDMWGGLDFFELVNLLELQPEKVLHGEQEYEYLGPLQVGQTLTVEAKVVERLAKAGMTFIKLETTYSNEQGEVLLIGRSTVIERS
jgi:hypothetical protein